MLWSFKSVKTSKEQRRRPYQSTKKREGQGKRTKRFAALLWQLWSVSELRGVGRRRSRHPCSCWCPSDKCFRMSCRAPFGRSQVRYPAHGLHNHNGSFRDLSAFDFIKLLQRPRDGPRRTDSLKNRESRFGQKAMAVRHDLFFLHCLPGTITMVENGG